MDAAPGTITHLKAMPVLVKSEPAKKALADHLRNSGYQDSDIVKSFEMMSSCTLADDLGAVIHDFFLDEIMNSSVIFWDGCVNREHDSYAVQVVGYEGIYYVFAVDYENVGYFLDKADALDFIHTNWDDVEGGWTSIALPR